ncbi:formate/nitrite transporter family protein [Chitinivorax sp. B]|uniref:formate/nitrite transporter family protein n=1 Tax=Chitinivorax sp. B TaxID=2502235 RepID=UPI0010F5E512|nr:formate/nitrite transporter family protein [Chitinivorax sp. B]
MAIYGFDVFSPREIAERIENVGVTKARLPLLQMALLGVLAGAFIGLGAMYFVLVISDQSLGFASSRLLGGVVFSLGLLLVVVAGAELFTGNNLLAMAWADRRITTWELVRNWLVVCLANFVGAVGLAMLVGLSGYPNLNGGAVGEQVVQLAIAKCSTPAVILFWKGLLCNVLVCMAVWMAMAGRSVIDKLVAVVFPVSAFVAAGFEHSVANMYLIPQAMFLKAAMPPGIPYLDALSWGGLFANLGPVIAGNLVGGSVLVALVYHLIYRRG